jgi:hypothetical protein
MIWEKEIEIAKAEPTRPFAAVRRQARRAAYVFVREARDYFYVARRIARGVVQLFKFTFL